MMNRKKTHIIILLIACLLVVQCRSVDRLYDKGKDSSVLEKVARKERRHRASKQDIKLAEQSFQRLQSDMLQQIENQYESSEEDKWVTIYDLGSKLNELQNLIKRQEPFRAKNGYVGQFEFIDLGKLKETASSKALDYFEAKGDEYLKEAKKSQNKQDAREAFTNYENALSYKSSEEVKKKRDEAKELGIIHIAAVSGNNVTIGPIQFSTNYIGSTYQSELNQMLQIPNSKWIKVHSFFPINTDEIDLVLSLNIDDIDINYETQNANEKQYSKTISSPVIGGNGRPLVDSLGRPITTQETVYATVTTAKKTKEAEVDLRLEIWEVETYHRVYYKTYYEENEDDSELCSISGDRRALPHQFNCSSNSQHDFDDDKDMIRKALNSLQYRVRKDIERELLNYD